MKNLKAGDIIGVAYENYIYGCISNNYVKKLYFY